MAKCIFLLNKFLVLGSLRSVNYIRLQYLFFKLLGSFKRFIFKNLFLCVCVCTGTCGEEHVGSPGAGVQVLMNYLMCVCWELNLGPLKEW